MPDATCTPNPEGLAFYDRLIDYLLEKGIEPLVTLYHFECPQALVDAFGGWLDRKMIDAYLKYAKVCFTHFKGPRQAVGHSERTAHRHRRWHHERQL